MAKKNKQTKTNAMRVLDGEHIAYEVREYECGDTLERDLGVKIAHQLGENPQSVFKTLVLTSEKEYVVCCIPVCAELDLKEVARISHHKHLDLLPLAQLQNITGYIRGGCTPIGLKRQMPVYIDETVELFDKVILSAGKPGLQMILAPQDLIQLTDGVCASITR